jgi:signal transduction histidine kinase/CheY-like chemotaxis protein/HPt (histidine-containing phosphotransfer) domain-containing protein
MENKSNNIPVKVFISYFALVALVIGVAWFLYSENIVYSKIESKIASEKNNVLQVSKIFSNLYKTESLSRKTIQSNSEKDFRDYIFQTNLLQVQIDSLKNAVSNQYQKKLLDSVTILLHEKIQNIRQLKNIKNKNTDETSVNNAIEELTKLEYSLQKLQLDDFTKNPDQLTNYQRSVLEKYVNYLNKNIPDDSTNTLTKKATDSILSASKELLSIVKRETEKKKESMNLRENKLLKNEILISDQLRKVLRIIEQEIIVYSNKNNIEKEKSLKKINQIVTFAAITGFLLTVFFSILIASDFSKTQLYKKQLEIANFKTKNLLKSREHLISTVSHDLKTPLSTIVGYTELLSNSDLTTKQIYFTRNIKNSSEYISRLVQDLLDFSQIEAGKISIEKIAFSLPETINEVASDIQSVFAKKEINLVISTDENLKNHIVGDPFRLKQVLINIIGNGYKFTESGFIKINAQINAKKIIITIEDSGIGIEKESQELVFEEFVQANETIEKQYGGTGLGLSISKKIITLLGGNLRLKLSSNKGSIFEIELPLIFAEGTQNILNNAVLSKNAITNKTIVVVDDDTDLLKLTTEVLKQNQFKVLAFTSAEEALKEMKKNEFDLLITDIQMPIMDGFTLTKAVRNIGQHHQKLPIIAVTGKNNLDLKNYQDAGFSTVIKKPFSPKTLLSTIQAIFNDQEIPFLEEEKRLKKPTELFALDSLQSFLNNDNEAVKSVLISFIETTSTNLSLLKNYYNVNDFERIKETAHKMAPMFKQIEATEIAAILTNLESKDYTEKELGNILKELNPKIKNLLIAIEKQLT